MPVGSATSAASNAFLGAPASSGGTQKMDTQTFDYMQLIVQQLKNQSPLNPSNSDQMIQQMSMIQQTNEIHTMNSNLSNWAQMQGLANSAGLIGRQATVLDANGQQTTGRVEGVAMVSGKSMVTVNGQRIPLSQIIAVQ